MSGSDPTLLTPAAWVTEADPGSRSAPLGDRGVLLLAAGTWIGACWAHPVPLWVGLGIGGLAVVRRRAWLLVVAAMLLAAGLGARAEAGMVPPPSGQWQGIVVLLRDPAPIPGGVRVDVRAGHRHLRLDARGEPAGALYDSWAGAHVWVEGRIGPLPGRAGAARVRHVAGQLQARAVQPVGGARPWWRWAHQARIAVEGLAEGLPPEARALFDGFVLGDDRAQSPEVAADFQASGLTHLLVVSGENVAFLLMLAGPLLRRLPWRARWGATVALLAGFALLTRFEPSVLRAVAMAAIATTAAALGRPNGGRRALALAVTALLLLDPFLGRSTGFTLSVAASVGILVGAVPLARLVPGPRIVARALAVTGAAQLGVAPVLVSRFGGLPIAALPANLAAAPAAAAVMVVGLPALLLARATGGPVAVLLRWPVRLLLQWVLVVARWGARLPLGTAGAEVVALVAVGMGVAHWADRFGRTGWRRGGQMVLFAALLLPALAVVRSPRSGEVLGGVTLVRSGGATVVVVDATVYPDDVLTALAAVGVARVDLLVLTHGGARDAEVARGLRHRWHVRRILVPAVHRVRGGTAVEEDQRWQVGGVTVEVRGTHHVLRVALATRDGPVRLRAS